MLAFYMDQNVHAGITHGLRRLGVDVLTALEDGRDRGKDPTLLDRALELKRVLITHDQDFHGISADRQRAGCDFFGIAFVRQEGLRIGPVVQYLYAMAVDLPPEQIRNRLQHVPN